jgi:hypothetical protein
MKSAARVATGSPPPVDETTREHRRTVPCSVKNVSPLVRPCTAQFIGWMFYTRRPSRSSGGPTSSARSPPRRWSAGIRDSLWASPSPRSASRIASTASRGAREGSLGLARGAPCVRGAASEIDGAPGAAREDRVTPRDSRPRLRTASPRITRASRGSSRASRGSSRASRGSERASRSLNSDTDASSRESL